LALPPPPPGFLELGRPHLSFQKTKIILPAPPAPISAYPSSVIGEGNLSRNYGGFWTGRFDASFVAKAHATKEENSITAVQEDHWGRSRFEAVCALISK